jgi:two-component system cell cycle sensor histidine kinase/response regulator CckA
MDRDRPKPDTPSRPKVVARGNTVQLENRQDIVYFVVRPNGLTRRLVPSVHHQNQLRSRAMSQRREPSGSAVAGDLLVVPRTGANALAGVLVVIAGAVAALALLSIGWAEGVVLALIGLLAAAGVLLVVGLVGGHIRLDDPVEDGQLAAALADTLADGIRVTDRDGREVYCNRAFAALVGQSGSGARNTLEEAFAGDPSAAEALYRLARAASRGEAREEELRRVRARGGEFDEGRWVRLSVRPLELPVEPASPSGLVVWQLADVTTLRAGAVAGLGEIGSTLSCYESMPLGLFVAGPDGTVEHMNATLAQSLGTPRQARGRGLRLADFVPDDGRAVLAALARQGESGRIDIDLVRSDGGAWPATLLVGPSDRAGEARTGARLVVAVLDRQGPEHADLADPRPAQLRSARLLQSAPLGIATIGAGGEIQGANPAFSRLLLKSSTVQGHSALELLAEGADADSRREIAAMIAAALAGKAAIPPAAIAVGPGKEYTRRVLASALPRAGGGPEAAMLCVIDATEQKALEIKYAQSQKMEAVGKLAGGIAHDFNNILTGIIGFCDLLVQTHRPTDPAYKNIMAIKSAADRAAATVRQLLAFSRRQTMQPQVLQLGDVLADFSVLLNRLLGEKIDLKIQQGRDLWHVKTDKNQLEQVVMNLAVNARDAMLPRGGRLTIRTRNVTERDSQKLAGLGVAVGEYVLIEVEDTGTGMAPEVMAKIFEPFFTTKGILKGTGLGLSTVYGIVKQTGGYVFPESALGKGTTFRVYLPAYHPTHEEEVAASRPAKPQAAADLTGSGRVLIVEDEDFVRSFAVEALRRQGYEVVTASTGLEGLEAFDAAGGRFDLVLTDVIMPEMDGPSLSNELHRRRPDIRIVFMSGYADDAFKNSLDPDTVFEFLPKPFTLAQLAAKVKEVIGR